jgi:hypothetical protein
MKIKSIQEYIQKIQEIRVSNPRASFLFRGQCNAQWNLTTSLERTGMSCKACEEYYKEIDFLKPLINPLISRRFDRKRSNIGYEIDFSEYCEISWELPEMEYLTYLRHHGYPTPLIDFTASEYIALFFACEDFKDSQNDSKVFVYVNKKWSMGGTDVPELRPIGRYIETSKRHLAQQSEYLVPIKYTESQWRFISFEEVLKRNTDGYEIIELEIDGKAKKIFISDLRTMNINRYTLYLDEDSLIKNFADEMWIRNNA